MKIRSLQIENIGIIIKEEIIFNEPLMLFIGKIKQGKTTILNTVKYVLGGKYPKDILRHGTDKGYGLIKFDDSSIKRVFRRKKDGTITADKIEFILNGELQDDPTKDIKRFLNPFTLDQNFFIDKSELEKNRYFVELFGVDVSGIDKDIKSTEQAARDLRTTISAYGEIDITPVEPADGYALKKERTKILDAYASEKLVLDKENEEIRRKNDLIAKSGDEILDIDEFINHKRTKILELENEIRVLTQNKLEHEQYIKENKIKNTLPPIPLPNTEKIDEKISDAKAQNERRKRYLENKERYDEKQKKRLELSEQEKQLRKLRDSKVKKLADVSDKCGVTGLTFDENAVAKYKGSTLGMISGSEAIELSSELQRLYPEGFGIELIDGAESTGMIYGSEFGEPVKFYIDKANSDETTILATIVGEKPAVVPGGVGVFIVKGGTLEKDLKGGRTGNEKRI